MAGYWTRTIASRRYARRKFLAGAAGVGAGALALGMIGCRGDGDGRESGGGSGLLSKGVDSTKEAKPGGNLVLAKPVDVLNIDPMTAADFLADFPSFLVSSRLVKYKSGTIDSPPVGDPEGDAADSWELSPDHLTLTFKLRNGLKFEPQAPVNGRDVTIDDVNYSWTQFSATHVARSNFLNSVNPDSPVLSLQTPDARTVVFKLKQPFVPIVSMFGAARGFVIVPKEAADKYNPRSEAHGSGPFMLTKYTPSVGFEYQRNPNWYMKDRPFFETISMPIIREYAQQLAQFESGAVWQFTPRPEDMIAVKKRHPQMRLLGTGWDAAYPIAHSMDWKTGSPFRDVRMRRALSMLIDRDLWIETFNDVEKYRSEGIELQTRWHSHFGAGDEKLWLDPKSGKLGEGSQYFKFNQAEAKKLISAAGSDGLEFPILWTGGTRDREIQVFSQMWRQNGGLNPTLKPLSRDERVTVCNVGGGKADGICGDLASGSGVDVDLWLDTRVRYGAGPYVPYTEPLPIIDDLCKAQKTEFDDKKRKDILLEIQKQMAVQMVSIPWPGLAESLGMSWPWLGNYGYVLPQNGGFPATEAYVHYWYDQSKKTV